MGPSTEQRRASTDSVIDHGTTILGWRTKVDRIKALTRVVYIDAAYIDAVTGELKSTVKAMTQNHTSGQFLMDYRVLFFNWNIVKDLELEPKNLKSTQLDSPSWE